MPIPLDVMIFKFLFLFPINKVIIPFSIRNFYPWMSMLISFKQKVH